MIFKLAWRNIWRNKRRSLITIGSILFAVFFSNLMNSVQQGMWEHNIAITTSLSGYIQIQSPDFWDEQILDNGLDPSDELKEIIMGLDGIAEVSPRIQTGSLAAHSNLSKFVLINAFDPETEKDRIGLQKKLDAGELIASDDDGILIGKGLAKYMELEVGDTLSLLGMGYYGQSANANFPVRGIVRFGTEQMSSNLVFMSYEKADEHFGTNGVVTSLNVYLEDINDLDEIEEDLMTSLADQDVEIMTWKEMMPELVQAFQADTGGNVIFIGILYLVIAFGIFGTILMMTAERMYV
ncbi:MAG: ABC transporter permease, partial [Flavobacteriales bacterium]|nr:ABC transporter permease [Flavobacteriales bacterium]